MPSSGSLSIFFAFFLPFFGDKADDAVKAVSLLYLTETALYLKVLYLVFVIGIAVYGILTLALQNCHVRFWHCNRDKISLIMSALVILLFIISSQPYAATVLFIFMLVKMSMIIKKR